MPVIRRAHWRGLTLIQCKPDGVLTAQSGPLVLQCYRSKVDHRWTATFHLEDRLDTAAPRFTAGADGPELQRTLELALERLTTTLEQSTRLLERCRAELFAVSKSSGFELGPEARPRKQAAKKGTP